MEASTVEPNRNKFSIVQQSEQTPAQLFCDGVTGVTVSAANFKLDLHQVISGDGTAEKRKIVQTLVIPTAALVELCEMVLIGIRTSPTMSAALDEHRAKILGSKSSAGYAATPVESKKN